MSANRLICTFIHCWWTYKTFLHGKTRMWTQMNNNGMLGTVALDSWGCGRQVVPHWRFLHGGDVGAASYCRRLRARAVPTLAHSAADDATARSAITATSRPALFTPTIMFAILICYYHADKVISLCDSKPRAVFLSVVNYVPLTTIEADIRPFQLW